MSTKAIRSTLKDHIDRVEDSLAGEISRAQRRTDEHRLQLAREALAELDAIEVAAAVMDKVMAGDTHTVKPAKAFDDAWKTMAAIARQGEKR